MDADAILAMLKKAQASGASATTIETLDDYGLGGIDCPLCGNKGYVVTTEDGMLKSRECSCMETRRSMKNIRESGLSDMLDRYTFPNFHIPDERRARIKQAALAFCDAKAGWFYISGKPGSGKTHICTAICGELIRRGAPVLYSLWRDEATRLKSQVTDSDEYQPRIEKLKNISVLYLDDFLKGRVTDADLNLAFEILNYRYNDSRKRTIISSERTMTDILDLDEALGGRIYERARGYTLAAPNSDWRLK